MKEIFRKLFLAFNETAKDRCPAPERGLTFAIRTDAAFATAPLKEKIIDYIKTQPDHPLHGKADLEDFVTKITHGAYQVWGHDILTAKAECLNYARYNLQEPEDKSLHVHFYNAHLQTAAPHHDVL